MITRKELYTIDYIPNKEITEALGYVKGAVVQTRHIGNDISAGVKKIFGGEIHNYSEMMNEARAIATERLLQDAEALGADAVIGFRLQTSSVLGGAAEIIAYGTAVKFK